MDIFVFGSNLQGIHGAGAALHAKKVYGAVPGVGSGPSGKSYAIPTKRQPTHQTRQLPLVEIQQYVQRFIKYAAEHPNDQFQVTRIGCGLAGYLDKEIAPMFCECPGNCSFDKAWRTLLPENFRFME